MIKKMYKAGDILQQRQTSWRFDAHFENGPFFKESIMVLSENLKSSQ